MQDYGVDDKKLDELLVRDGAGTYKKGHWLPVSTLVFGQPLEYVLKNKDTGQDELKRLLSLMAIRL